MKPLTDKQKIIRLREVLEWVQTRHLHEPDSDSREYCFGCGRSPYNVPPHGEGCLVVEIAKVLEKTK